MIKEEIRGTVSKLCLDTLLRFEVSEAEKNALKFKGDLVTISVSKSDPRSPEEIAKTAIKKVVEVIAKNHGFNGDIKCLIKAVDEAEKEVVPDEIFYPWINFLNMLKEVKRNDYQKAS